MDFSYPSKIHTSELKQEKSFETIFEIWEKVIIGANKNYRKGQVFASIGAYHQAITLSKKLMARAPTNYRSLSALVSSFHNLSDTYLYHHSPREEMVALRLAYSLITQVEAIITDVEQRFSQNVDVLRFASIARQQKLLFIKNYPQHLAFFDSHDQQNEIARNPVH